MLPDTYKKVYEYADETTLNEEETVVTTKLCSIILTGGLPRNRCISTGRYAETAVRLTFNVYGGRTDADILEALAYCDTIKETLDTAFNVEYVDAETGKEIRITNFRRDGDTNRLGRNNQGVTCYSINYQIIYTKGGN
jgi:hypothetical protein